MIAHVTAQVEEGFTSGYDMGLYWAITEPDKAKERIRDAAPDLLTACEALHDALSRILEFSLTEDRKGNLYNENGESVLSRDQRAHGLLAIRKSFKALVKAKGEP